MDEPLLYVLVTLTGVTITAVVTWSIAQRRIAMKHVTEERAKWRKQVRKLALQIHDAIPNNHGDIGEARIRRLNSKLRAHLNPFSSEDEEILNLVTATGSNDNRQTRADEFSERISLLLKHDWERAKLEASWFLPRWTLEARRHRLECKEAAGCQCPDENGLRRWYREFTFRYKVKPLQAWVLAGILAVVLIVALVAIVCAFCHCFGQVSTKHTSMPVLVDASMHGARVTTFH